VNRLQEGAAGGSAAGRSGGIIARSLGSIGPQAGAVMIWFPPGLPLVMADPPFMERVIASATANVPAASGGTQQ